MDYADYEVDYTEEDLQALLRERRFLAAAHGYAIGLMPFGQAKHLAFDPRRRLHTLSFSSDTALSRLFHEAAVRVAAGQIPIPSELQKEYPDIYRTSQRPEMPSYMIGPPFDLHFEELSQSDQYARYLKRKRQKFNEDDIRVMIENELFLACVDAYQKEIINGAEAIERVFPDLKYIPRDLSRGAYGILQIEVADRIFKGKISIHEDLQDRYPEAYLPIK